MSPTLLLPGLDGTGRLFQRVIAAGLTGRVLPIPREGQQHYAAWARSAEAELLAAPEPVNLVAESFSTPVAVRLAAAHPDRVRALVLVSAFDENPLTPFRRRLAMLVQRVAFTLPPPLRVVRAMLAGPEASTDLAREIRATIRTVPGAILRARVNAVLDLTSEWTWQNGRPRCAVLVLHGTGDRLVPPPVKWSGELLLIPGPHLLLQAMPTECARVIREFLAAQTGGEYQSI